MFDWDDLRFFLAVARHGTLAAAARDLHVTQSTVSRRLIAFQDKLGVRLLRRTADGYVLTLAGESIRTHVELVEKQALMVERAVAGSDTRLDGVVRVASSQILTSYLLAPSFAALHGMHPGIQIVALPEVAGEQLETNAADIVVRLRRFDHHDLVVRNIGLMAFGLYGCVAYLARQGQPDLEDGCAGHRLITQYDERTWSPHAEWLAEHAAKATVVLEADSYETQHSSVGSSGGLALLPCFRANSEPAFRRVPTPAPIPPAEIWLGVHRENRQVPRVRTVLDTIAETVRSQSAVLNPPA